MARKLQPGTLSHTIQQVRVAGKRNAHRSVTAAKLAGVRQAKINASSGAHPRGTPTPARKGSGPARITGNLVRSIVATPTAVSDTVVRARYGVARSGYYGQYVETVYNYPFLRPSAQFLKSIAWPAILRREFTQWPHNG